MSKSVILHVAICLAAGLLLSGCVGMYGGVDRGLANVGAVKRGDNLYDVVYMGKDGASADYRRDMALMQSAELCKSQGFGFFKASDTQVFSNFGSPDTKAVKPAEAPQVTLQVSCHTDKDAETILPVDTVIARITSQYSQN